MGDSRRSVGVRCEGPGGRDEGMVYIYFKIEITGYAHGSSWRNEMGS